jgi:hypothetical protein
VCLDVQVRKVEADLVTLQGTNPKQRKGTLDVLGPQTNRRKGKWIHNGHTHEQATAYLDSICIWDEHKDVKKWIGLPNQRLNAMLPNTARASTQALKA